MKRMHQYLLFIFGIIGSMAPLDAVSIVLTQRQLCDLEMILVGAFAPLTGFMNQKDYLSVVKDMRLADGSLWPMPIVLDVPESMAEQLAGERTVTLVTSDYQAIATLEIAEIYKPDKTREALGVYGTMSKKHPGVNYLLTETHDYYIGGKIKKIADVPHYDFVELRKTPAELKRFFKEKGYERIVAFQTRNPMHCAHVELTKRAAQRTGAHLLIHPAVGETRPGDVPYCPRVRCYKEVLKYYPEESATLSLLPIAMRMGGPREALWHAIIRKNYGCTHFIIGRDHAGPGVDEQGNNFYGLYDAQRLVMQYAQEIGIEIAPFQEIIYTLDEGHVLEDEVRENSTILRMSGTGLRKLLKNGLEIPAWFTFPEVANELQKTYPPRSKQGFTLFLTGLPSAGKSTLAQALSSKLEEMQDRSITILDGDVIRKHLSSELGFSKEHRSLNVRRVAFVANEITKNGGIAIVAMIAPFAQDREYGRNLISQSGSFIEVYVATPVEACEGRDPKGLYAAARCGKVKNFTGISDPYEEPMNPEIRIDTSGLSIQEEIEIVVSYLKKEGYLQ
jgi:sulfate adenylyltransferase